jgi:hypothetical protein
MASISDGKMGEANEWRKMDVFDFFYALRAQQQYIRDKTATIKKAQGHGEESRTGVRGGRKPLRRPSGNGPGRGATADRDGEGD